MSSQPETSPNERTEPRLGPGQIVATQAALDALDESQQSPLEFLARHLRGDWGNVCPEDARSNDESLGSGARLMSVYETRNGTRLWIITDAEDERRERRCTTILLPHEY